LLYMGLMNPNFLHNHAFIMSAGLRSWSGRCSIMISALALLAPQAVFADADFSGDATLTLSPQAPIVNRYGYGSDSSPITINNNGSTTYNESIAPPATLASGGVNLGNFTGAYVNSPSETPLTISLGYSLNYNLTTYADPSTPSTMDDAMDELTVKYTAVTTFYYLGYFGVKAYPNVTTSEGTLPSESSSDGNNAIGTDTGSISLSLPADSETVFTITLSLTGSADSQMQQPPMVTPEPGQVVAASVVALLGMGGFLVRRKSRPA
jgi:hypothetical protein